MLHKFGFLIMVVAGLLVILYRWMFAQIETLAELKEWVDTGLGITMACWFIWYLMQKEKLHNRRLEKKDEEIKKLYERLNNK